MIKVFLDDIRMEPKGWIRTYTPTETIKLINLGIVEAVSLDHDLGDDEVIGTGYDVIIWIEEKTATDENFIPPKIFVHSDNISAKEKMLAGIKSIEKIYKNRFST